jgi:hypothetical protein
MYEIPAYMIVLVLSRRFVNFECDMTAAGAFTVRAGFWY